MPQAVMYVDGDKIAQQGFMSPTKSDLKSWARECIIAHQRSIEQYVGELGFLGLRKNPTPQKSRVDEHIIRLEYEVVRRDDPTTLRVVNIGFYIDRRALWAS